MRPKGTAAAKSEAIKQHHTPGHHIPGKSAGPQKATPAKGPSTPWYRNPEWSPESWNEDFKIGSKVQQVGGKDAAEVEIRLVPPVVGYTVK